MTIHTTPLTLAKVRDYANKAVNNRGFSYVYDSGESSNSCYYGQYPADSERDENGHYVGPIDRATPTAPGCIVGHILHQHGWTLEELQTLDGEGSIGELHNKDLVAANPHALVFLKGVQQLQDKQVAWGTAVDAVNTLFYDLNIR